MPSWQPGRWAANNPRKGGGGDKNQSSNQKAGGREPEHTALEMAQLLMWKGSHHLCFNLKVIMTAWEIVTFKWHSDSLIQSNNHNSQTCFKHKPCFSGCKAASCLGKAHSKRRDITLEIFIQGGHSASYSAYTLLVRLDWGSLHPCGTESIWAKTDGWKEKEKNWHRCWVFH